ncbi:MAG: adenylate/guanylate cyclase domain-containing protein [Actinomycetota bacterium]
MDDTPQSDQSVADLNSRANLTKLLDELGEYPEHPDEIESRIKEIFEQEKAILILDMSGFTRTTHRSGIIRFLLMIHQMQRLALPSVEEHNGLFVNAFADNLTCLFDSVHDAVIASTEVARRLKSANVVLPADRELYVSVGIGYGPILNVANEAIYGSEVNLASKLGEDIAELGEVLLTTNAHEQIKDAEIECTEHSISVSGLEVTYYSVTT